MRNIFVFAGTTEGRKIGEFLEKEKIKGYMSVATEYGKEAAGSYQYVEVLHGRMEQQEMQRFFIDQGINLVIDATHPFARIVTQNIKEVCKRQGIRYFRCLRERIQKTEEEDVYFVSSIKDAVGFLEHTEGNILIATGSKELHEYQNLSHYRERCYARVLSVMESVEKAVQCGFTGAHLIAMQGPFGKEMNLATLKQVKAKWFVTKEAGDTGGFLEKREAAKALGAKLVVIERPDEDGMSLEEILGRIRRCSKNSQLSY